MKENAIPLRVEPTIPAAIARLDDLATNLWFSWSPTMRQLFARLDPVLWLKAEGNPKLFLKCLDQGILDRAAEDDSFIGAYRRVLAEFDAYLEQGSPYRAAELGEDDLVAYFCAEYGFHESFPIYSGGLGILAGDHCKTASDLRLPFVGVGLLYRQGYFRQRIDRHGQQIPEYQDNDPEDTPIRLATDSAGREIVVDCAFPGRAVVARVWQADVGRVRVLLLDTNVPQNSEADRNITRVLYGGDRKLRLQQEAVLGIGGVRALRAVGLAPTVWHMNEGHAAFLVLERVRELIQSGLPFDAALEAVAAATLFTTHTPVAAGHDVFPRELVGEHIEDLVKDLGIDTTTLLDLGGVADFNMTRLALRGAAAVNGVSRIHGRVSSELCRDAWPDVRPPENPVGYVTNGVHVPTFMRESWAEALDEHLGPAWRQHLLDRTFIERVTGIPDARFWYASQQNKRQVLTALRARLTRQAMRNGLSEAHIHRLLKSVDPDDPNVLTVGFARRFATYKRSTLLLSNLRWLEQLVSNEDRPVLFVFAGKAHPADEPGQWMMREIQRISSQPPFVGKLLLVEGYDIGMGRLLTSGVDVWLNTPVHPFEASGTSGMKAAINGTVNLSVLDGWWAEAYDGRNGWGIRPSADDQSAEERDRQDSITLYEILQDEVIPLYYDRDEKLGYSPGWVEICKRAMATSLPYFNSQRVVDDYARYFYAPGAKQGRTVAANDYAVARDLAAWKASLRAAWPGVSLANVNSSPRRTQFDQTMHLEVDVKLNGLRPEDVRIECVLSREMCSELTVPVKSYAETHRANEGVVHWGDETVLIRSFTPQPNGGSDVCRYTLDFKPPWSGLLSYEIRAVPRHPHLSHPYELGLMRWL
jgi:glycogen phosphorylase